MEFEDVEELGVSVGELVEDGRDPARVAHSCAIFLFYVGGEI